MNPLCLFVVKNEDLNLLPTSAHTPRSPGYSYNSLRAKQACQKESQGQREIRFLCFYQKSQT